MPRPFIFLLAAAALLLGACQVSLAGDISPPPGSQLQAAGATPTPQPVEYPAQIPDPVNGAQVYIESCAPCHGASGRGDGDQAGELPFAPAPIGDPELAYASAPLDWYRMISNGNLDRFMPPFAEALSVQQRWDVLAYALSLSWDQDLLGPGEVLFLEAKRSLPAADVEGLADQSVLDLAATFEDYSQPDALALATYLQSEAFGLNSAAGATAEEGLPEASPSEGTPQAEAEPTAVDAPADAGDGIVIAGQVSNGTAGGDIPSGAEVLLRAFDQSTEVSRQSGVLDADGRYRFESVELQPGLVYAITIDYEGLIYFSEAITAEDGQAAYELPLTIYDTTSDTSMLVIERLQIVFDFSTEGVVQVVQLVSIVNSGDRAVTPSSEEEPALLYSLPADARSLAFESGAIGERYIPTEGGFGDLRAVLPGHGVYQLLYAFELPYNRGLDFEQPLNLAVDGVTVFTPAGEIELQSDDFTTLGVQQLDTQVYTGYQAQAGYAAGDLLQFELNGAHPLGGGNSLQELANQDDLLVGLVGLTAAVAVAWLWLRRLNAPGPRPEEIMDAIIALDTRYAEDAISEDIYLKRRAALKQRLRQALAAQGTKRL